MAKIKRVDPLFLTFVNLPIHGNKKLEVINYSNSFDRPPFDNPELLAEYYDSSIPKMRTSARSCIEHILKIHEEHFPKNRLDRIINQIYTYNFDNSKPDISLDEFVVSMLKLWYRIRQFIRGLIIPTSTVKFQPATPMPALKDKLEELSNRQIELEIEKETRELELIESTPQPVSQPKPQPAKPKPKFAERLSVFHQSDPILPGVDPVLRMKEKGGFEINLEPILDEEEYLTKTPELKIPEIVRFISADFSNFLLKNYRDDIFAYCELHGCDRVILTTNGRKYCSPYHRRKVCLQAKERDFEYREHQRIRDKLRKRFDRHPHKHKMNREKFIGDNWDKNKLHLYHPPRSPK